MPLIFLTGMCGAGKSTVGERLAARLGMPFVDVDAEIERVAGASVSEVFDRRGESAFRDLESACIREISSYPHAVVALGAGALERDENYETVSRCGTVVYLRADVPLISHRLAHAAPRPLLASATTPQDLQIRLQDLLCRREKRYLSAEIILDMGENRTLDETVGVLVWELARRRGPMISR